MRACFASIERLGVGFPLHMDKPTAWRRLTGWHKHTLRRSTVTVCAVIALAVGACRREPEAQTPEES